MKQSRGNAYMTMTLNVGNDKKYYVIAILCSNSLSVIIKALIYSVVEKIDCLIMNYLCQDCNIKPVDSDYTCI